MKNQQQINDIMKFMRNNLLDFVDEYNEVQLTQLGEYTAQMLDLDEQLDVENSNIWECAYKVSLEYANRPTKGY